MIEISASEVPPLALPLSPRCHWGCVFMHSVNCLNRYLLRKYPNQMFSWKTDKTPESWEFLSACHFIANREACRLACPDNQYVQHSEDISLNVLNCAIIGLENNNCGAIVLPKKHLAARMRHSQQIRLLVWLACLLHLWLCENGSSLYMRIDNSISIHLWKKIYIYRYVSVYMGVYV